jgi:hypothetical protein
MPLFLPLARSLCQQVSLPLRELFVEPLLTLFCTALLLPIHLSCPNRNVPGKPLSLFPRPTFIQI